MSTQKKHAFKQHKFTLLDNTSSHVPSGNITFIMSFVIPLVIFISLYYIRGIYPFGTKCYLRSDMYHQYAPFFSELWNKLRNGEALTYSWNIGMGTNFTSLTAYYLSCPLNWIIILFPQKNIIEVMNALIIIKLSASCVTICYYISRHFHTKSCVLVLFGLFYGMSGYVAAYSWNIMWLDCIVLLPLIMLGLEELVNNNKCMLYCISLGVCILTNYYIGIMVCIAVSLYFLILLFAYNGNKNPFIYLKKIIRWVLYSLLAGGLSACFLLPEIYTFSLSASSGVSFPKKVSVYFSVVQMLTRQLMNIPIHMGLEHHPNIYCGVAIFLLIPLYIMNKKINVREKIGKVFLLLFFLVSFNLNTLNFIWHGFHFPNSLPCRQAFIYIFFLIVMSYEAFHYMKENTHAELGKAVIFAIGFLVIIEQLFNGDENISFKTLYISGIFILLYGLILYLYQNTALKVPVVLFAAFAVAIIEVTVNMENTGLSTTSRTSYLLDYDAVKTVTETIEENDSDFYRMDKIAGARTKNDGAWHNYKTISTFSSTSNAGISTLYEMLGNEHSTNAYSFNGSTLVTQSLFSVKYLISNRHLAQSDLITYKTGSNGEFIYQNNYALSLGFMIPSDTESNWTPIKNVDYSIQNQNHLIASLTGISSLFVKNYEFNSVSDQVITPVTSGHMYILPTSNDNAYINVSVNDDVINFTNMNSNQRIMDIGYVSSTDNVEVYAEKPMSLEVYTLDESKYKAAMSLLKEQSLNISKYSSTKVEGTIEAKQDGNLLFSIPFDKGWSVYIDGKKVSTSAFENALLTVPVSKGSHTVKLKYRPVNLILGCIITILCIIILIAIHQFKKLLKLGKIKLSTITLFIQNVLNEKDIILTENIPVSNKNKRKKVIPNLEDLNDFDNLELHDKDN